MNNLKAREIHMSDHECEYFFGKSKEEMYDFFNPEIYDVDAYSLQMMAMGILSDAQDILGNDNAQATRLINVAKWIMNHLNRPVR